MDVKRKMFETQYERYPVEWKPSGDENETKDMTRQEFVQDCDMNILMKRFKANPALAVDQFREAQAAFMDFTDLPDYQTMLQAGVHAREMFMALPPEVRFKFHNDPGEFLDACETMEGQKILVELGLATPRQPARGGESGAVSTEEPSVAKASKKKPSAGSEESGQD